MISRAGTILLLVSACGRERNAGTAGGEPAGGSDPGGARSGTDPATAADSLPRILFLGTSLTAGLGVDPEAAYPALIQARLDSAGIPLSAVNAGVSGETSAGALRRIPSLLHDSIRVLVIETGANDGLRGLDPDSTMANIAAIVGLAREYDRSMAIVLAQMEAPPNMGARFTSRFRRLFPEVARREGLVLMPFLLDGVAGVDSLNQDDGIHPTRRGHEMVAANVWATLEPVLRPGGGPRDRGTQGAGAR